MSLAIPKLPADWTFSLLRVDDLVDLTVTVSNLRLDTTDPHNPKLVRAVAGQPATLLFQFAPQSLAEQAFFEEADITPSPDSGAPSGVAPRPDPATSQTPLPPGEVGLRMSGSSRLAFQVSAAVEEIPYTSAGLLDWAQLTLLLPPAALVPAGQSSATGQAPPPVAEPDPKQSSIEILYRLAVAPNVTAGGEPAWVHSPEPVEHEGRVELWHTRLARRSMKGKQSETVEASPDAKLPLRAVWSPDYVSDGPLPDHSTDGLPFSSQGVSAMSARDRDQIVILTSGFSGYMLMTATGSETYVPVPVEAERLFLSSLGGWLTSRGSWPYPVTYQYQGPVFTDPILQARVVGSPPARAVSLPSVTAGLDLIEWDHVATQGRDHYVRIVYEGFLYPFGHRATLVKVTERHVLAPNGTEGNPSSSPVAYLRQRMYIVVREREKTYAPAAFAHAGREMPFEQRVRLKVLVTPDIAQPTTITGAVDSFLVMVGASPYMFPVVGTDPAGADVDFLAPLVFVGLGESGPGLTAVTTFYAGNNPRRRCDVRGRNIAFADPGDGDTTLKTTALYFTAEAAAGAEPPYVDPPFLPALDSASVIVPALTALTGQTSAVQVQYYGPYLTGGIDPHAGVFLQLVGTPTPVAFTADKTGGLSRPNLGLTALSSRKGLVSGSPDDAAAGQIKPSEFFGDLDAKLFGTIPLGALIPVQHELADAAQNAPEIHTKATPNRKHPQQIVTHLEWAPQLFSYKVDPVHIEFDNTSALVLKVELTTHLDGSPPSSIGHGELKNFKLSLLGVIALVITSIKFDSSNGAKSTVSLQLAKNNPIQFDGPLRFIQQLADILPPGLFGGSGGPKITPTPTELDVSYTIGLPPISCGIFSLQNIAIMTGLDLPYLDGKPGVEFGFATRSSPFLVTVEIFGGGGFVHLLLDTDGIKMVEGAIEFGGNFSFDIGVASGGVHAMAGVYFQLKGKDSDLTGFVDIGGEVSVLGIISISMDLNLSLSWQHSPSGNVIEGRATLSVSVHVLFFSASVSISVERSFSAGGGDPKIDELVSASQWDLYVGAFA